MERLAEESERQKQRPKKIARNGKIEKGGNYANVSFWNFVNHFFKLVNDRRKFFIYWCVGVVCIENCIKYMNNIFVTIQKKKKLPK